MVFVLHQRRTLTHRSGGFLAVLLFAILPMAGAGQEAQPRALQWSYTGPCGGGDFLALAASSPSTVYVATSQGFFYRSTDRGATWRLMNRMGTLLGGLSAFAVHPQDPDVLYAGTTRNSAFEEDPIGLFKSTDGGETWTKLNVTGSYVTSFVALAIDPEFPQVIYAGTDHYTRGTVYRSVDDGVTWSDVASVREIVSDLVIHRQDPKIVYAGKLDLFTAYGDRGLVIKTDDRGLHWRVVADGSNGFFVDRDQNDPPDFEDPQDTYIPAVIQIVADSFQTDIAYVRTYNGPMFKTLDGGERWFPIGQDNACGGLVANPVVPDRLHCPGVRSDDGGLTWMQVGDGSTSHSSLTIDPRDGQTFYAFGNGVMRSTNVGENWVSISPKGDSVRALVFLPDKPNSMLAGTDGGLARTEDGGVSWQLVNEGLENAGVHTLLVHPADGKTWYMARDNGRYYKSLDEGRTWTSIQGDLPFYSPHFMAVDPTDVRRIYVGAARKVFQSRNGGVSWNQMTTLPSPYGVYALLIDPKSPTTHYANTGEGPFRSLDRGKTWAPIEEGLPEGAGNASILLLDPILADVVYAQADGDLYRFEGANLQWQLWHDWTEFEWFASLRAHPAQPSTFFTSANTTDTEQVFRSVDRGKTWAAYGPVMPQNQSGVTLFLHPTRPDVLFAGLYNQGGLMVLQPEPSGGGPVPAFPQAGVAAVLLVTCGVLFPLLRRLSAGGRKPSRRIGDRLLLLLVSTWFGAHVPLAEAGADSRDASILEVNLEWQISVLGSGIGNAGLNAADLDGDGVQEVVAAAQIFDYAFRHFWYVLQHEGGAYVHRWTSLESDRPITSIRTADLDGDGAAEVIMLAGNDVDVYAGLPPVLQLSIPTGVSDFRGLHGLAVGDVDADGVFEAVFSSSESFEGDLYVYDLRFGGPEFYGRRLGGVAAAVGNVDADPGLEIVVGSRYGPGRVLDGKTRAVEWTAPQDFGTTLTLADLDGDGNQEIVAARPQSLVRAFDAERQEEAWAIPGISFGGGLAVEAGNAGGDPEVLFGDSAGNILIHDARTGLQKRVIQNPVSGISDLVAADLDRDGTLEALWAAGLEMFVADTAIGALEWRSESFRGPFYALDHGDFDGDGEQELLFAPRFDEDGHYFVYDVASRALEYEGMASTGNSDSGQWRVRHANVDEDPQSELFFTTSDRSTPQLVCIDGLTHAEQWRLAAQGGNSFLSLAVADVDQDGSLELVAVADDSTLYVYDAASGRREGYVEAMGGHPTLLRAAQLDQDPALELLVADTSSGSLVVVDGKTRTVQLESLRRDITALETADRDGDGIAEILVGTGGGEIWRLDTQTGEPVDLVGAYESRPGGSSAIQGLALADLTEDGRADLVFGFDEQAWIYDGGTGGPLWNSGIIGRGVGAEDSLLVADVDQDGNADILLNEGNLGIRLYETVHRLVVLDAAPEAVVTWGAAGVALGVVLLQRRSPSRRRGCSSQDGGWKSLRGMRGSGWPLGLFCWAWALPATAVADDLVPYPLDSEFQVNEATVLWLRNPNVSWGTGDFVVSWQDFNQTPSTFFMRFDSAGRILGRQTKNTASIEIQTTKLKPSVSADAVGNFVVVWESHASDLSVLRIRGQRFSSTGGAEGGVFDVFPSKPLETSPVHAAAASRPVSVGPDGGILIEYGETNPRVSRNRQGDFVAVAQYYGTFAQLFDSAGVPKGGRVLFGTPSITGNPRLPVVAIDEQGGFVAVWEEVNDFDLYGAVAQRFDSNGGSKDLAFDVNTTSGRERLPEVATDSEGNFVVVWNGFSTGSFGQRWDSAGSARGERFQISTSGTPSVGSEPGGSFVVVWSAADDGDGSGVFAQRYASTGVLQGGSFQINTLTSGKQTAPRAALDESGGLAVIWSGPAASAQAGDTEVFVRRYDPAGSPLGTELQVNTWTTGIQKQPAIAKAADGSFAVWWESEGQNGSAVGLAGQRFDSAGAPQGGELSIFDAYAESAKSGPVVAADAADNFVLVWTSPSDGDDSGVFAQRFDSNGQSQGEPFRVNQTIPGVQTARQIARTSTGTFVVAWRSPLPNSPLIADHYIRCFAADGTPLTDEFIMNSPPAITSSSSASTAVALNDAGDGVAVWETSAGVHARRFGCDGRPQTAEFSVSPASTRGIATGIEQDGDFIVAWSRSAGQDWDIFAKRYSSTGALLGEEFRVNSSTLDTPYWPDLAVDGNGNFVVVWTTPTSGGHWLISGRFFDSQARPLGEDFDVSDAPWMQFAPSVSLREPTGSLQPGHFAVIWESRDFNIFGRLYALGTPTPTPTPQPLGSLGQPGRGGSFVAVLALVVVLLASIRGIPSRTAPRD